MNNLEYATCDNMMLNSMYMRNCQSSLRLCHQSFNLPSGLYILLRVIDFKHNYILSYICMVPMLRIFQNHWKHTLGLDRVPLRVCTKHMICRKCVFMIRSVWKIVNILISLKQNIESFYLDISLSRINDRLHLSSTLYKSSCVRQGQQCHGQVEACMYWDVIPVSMHKRKAVWRRPLNGSSLKDWLDTEGLLMLIFERCVSSGSWLVTTVLELYDVDL